MYILFRREGIDYRGKETSILESIYLSIKCVWLYIYIDV